MFVGILEKKREEREKREIKKFEVRRLAREFELERLRAQLSNKLNEYELKAWNKINNLANVSILSENRTRAVSEPVNKCRPLINPVVNKSVENATSCGFENENCDPQSSDCEVKMKVGVCEGRVRAVVLGAQRVINPDNIGGGSFELKGDKGVANPEGLICENICEEKYTIGTLMGCEKQLTVDQESFRNHTMVKIAGQLNGGKKTCVKQGNLRKRQLYLKLPPDRSSYLRMINAKKKEGFPPDPGTIVLRQKDINLITGKPFTIKTCCSSQMLINTLREDTVYLLYLQEFEPGDASRDLSFVRKGKFCRKEQRGIVGQQIDFVLKWLSRVGSEVGPTKGETEKKETRERSPALDLESMRGEPWLEWTGRERERKGFSPRLEWKDDKRRWH
ncbi:uncharacterized protein TNCV_4268481 [Trichonephila clavipes]|nr:uncharacterized protein TNCV_4268481 [Trichonephila clavipes]